MGDIRGCRVKLSGVMQGGKLVIHSPGAVSNEKIEGEIHKRMPGSIRRPQRLTAEMSICNPQIKAVNEVPRFRLVVPDRDGHG